MMNFTKLLRQVSLGSIVLLQCICSAEAISLAAATPDDTIRVRKNILQARAILPAASFATGPTSGKLLGRGPINAQEVPFVNKQPIQGFSAVLRRNDTTYWVMADNGFGAIENSSDFNLRVYNICPDFKTKAGGRGEIVVRSFFQLRDPDKKIPFAITNHFSAERILTGADFDIESFQRVPDGTLWFGDEFGPFLIHTDSTGKVLEPPIGLPDFENPGKEIRSPQNPFNEEGSALRIMNAVKSNAFSYGSTRVPVISPNFGLIDDGNLQTFQANRDAPSATSGLARASSEIFNIASLKQAGFPVVAWTVNDTVSMKALIALGINGIISDRPDLLRKIVEKYDGNGDKLPDFLDADGLIDVTLFDAQGHRGARNLRPENTLPAMEAALDNLISTLETDCGITSDGVPVLNHDPHIEAIKFRRRDGAAYTPQTQVLIKDLTFAQIQSTYIGDLLLTGRPDQTNDRALSPVAVAFATQKALPDPYVMPSLQQLFDFVKFYITYYQTGAGSTSPDAARRWKNAQRIRYNLETKINPRSDTDPQGTVYASRTVLPEPFAKAVADVIVTNQLEQQADIQSFDFRTLLVVQANYPRIRTVFLFNDSPRIPGSIDDGTNLQPENGNSPWLGGLYWPYRSTRVSNPFRAARSGGFEGMALDSTGKFLFPLLEKPLAGHRANRIMMHEFNLTINAYTGKRFRYLFQPKGTAIGDFVLFGRSRGLIIERDETQGLADGFKAIYEIQLNADNETVGKRLVVNLMNIRDTSNLSLPGLAGDVAVGPTFGFPFQTIEDVVVLSPTLIGVLNDNNYPFSVGRHKGAAVSDDNEFILVELDRRLGAIAIPLADTIGAGGINPITGINLFETSNSNKATLTWCYPNPFTGITQINYELSQPALASIHIYNQLGVLVKTLVNKQEMAGAHQVEWNSEDDRGNKCSAGIYYYTYRFGSEMVTKKLVIAE